MNKARIYFLSILLISFLGFSPPEVIAQQQQARMSLGVIGGSVSASAPTYLLSENFDGSTECLSGYTSNCQNAWLSHENAVTFNDTTMGLNGTYNLKVDATTAWSATWYHLAADVDEIYLFFMFQTSNVGSTGDRTHCIIYDSGNNIGVTVYTRDNVLGTFKITSGAGSTDTANHIHNGDNVCVWIYFKRNDTSYVEFQTAADGVCTYVGSGNNHATRTPSADIAVHGFDLYSSNAGGAGINYYDRVIVSETAIGNVTVNP
jgi:hypothetical protein